MRRLPGGCLHRPRLQVLPSFPKCRAQHRLPPQALLFPLSPPLFLSLAAPSLTLPPLSVTTWGVDTGSPQSCPNSSFQKRVDVHSCFFSPTPWAISCVVADWGRPVCVHSPGGDLRGPPWGPSCKVSARACSQGVSWVAESPNLRSNVGSGWPFDFFLFSPFPVLDARAVLRGPHGKAAIPTRCALKRTHRSGSRNEVLHRGVSETRLSFFWGSGGAKGLPTHTYWHNPSYRCFPSPSAHSCVHTSPPRLSGQARLTWVWQNPATTRF